MAEELQSLLEKIQREGIEKANAKSAELISEAKKKSDALLSDAERKVADMNRKAESDAAVLLSRSEQSIRQAARDIVLGVQQAVSDTLSRVLLDEVGKTLKGDFLQTYLLKVVEQLGDVSGAEVHVAPADAEALATFARAKLATAVQGGLKIVADRDVGAGISVRMEDGRIEHSFTAQSVLEAMSATLRPSLAKLLSESGK